MTLAGVALVFRNVTVICPFVARWIVADTVLSPVTKVTAGAAIVGVGDGLNEGEGLEEAVATVEGAGLGLGVGNGVPGVIISVAGPHAIAVYGGRTIE